MSIVVDGHGANGSIRSGDHDCGFRYRFVVRSNYRACFSSPSLLRKRLRYLYYYKRVSLPKPSAGLLPTGHDLECYRNVPIYLIIL